MSQPASHSSDPAAPDAARLVSLTLLITTGILWGGVIVAAKFGITQGIPPFGYGVWTMLWAGTIVFAVCVARGTLPPVTGPFLRYYLLTGLVRVALPNAILYIVLRHVPAGVMAVLLTMSPVFTYAMAVPLGIERFAWLRFSGVLTGLAGALLLVLPKGSLPSPDLLGWVLLGFGTPFFYATANLVIDRRRPDGAAPLPLASATLYAGGLLLLPVAALTGELYMVALPLAPGDYAIIIHGVLTAMCFMGQFALIRRAGAVFTSQVSYLITLSGVVWSAVLLGERHTLFLWAALLLIFAGVYMVTRRQDARA